MKLSDADIIGIQETHLDSNTSNQPLLDGYRWFGHCRNIRHIRSKLTYGGIGLFIRESMFDTYTISILDKSYEGILCLLFRDKISEYTFTVYCCYLAPEQSPYGRNSAAFYNHLLSLIYVHNFVDASFCIGDFNGRISDKPDIINAVDGECATRNVIDTGHNKHGDALLDFLIESRMVVTNGRIPEGTNDFTSISSKGTAVVDYIVVPQENMVNCYHFNVETMSEIMSKNNLEPMLSTRCKAPDHSLLTLKYSIYQHTSDSSSSVDEQRSEESVFKKYNYGTMSTEFMKSPSWVAILDSMISRIESSLKTQSKVDELYDCMLSDIFKEMDAHIEYRSASKRSRKHYKNHKPFWNADLTNAWKIMVKAEKLYISNPRNTDKYKNLRTDYLSKRKIFDKLLRNTERKYNRDKALEIESINTSNPTEFWKYVNSLGPKRKTNIPMQVYDDSDPANPIKINDEQAVLDRWKDDFHDLYNMPDDMHSAFDNSFYEEIKSNLPVIQQTELNACHDLYEYNCPFTLEEIDKICRKMKPGKAVGIDVIPNEVLQHEGIRELLLTFINMCYISNVIPSVWRTSIISPIPKSSSKDPCVPLNYRGISLLSCLYKMYTSLLNMRLANYCEGGGYLADEQNGFRSGRSCQDHIYTLSSIIKNRKSEGNDTYCAFVDFKKAFDWVPRDLLLYKLATSFDVHGRLFNSLSTIFESSSAQIRLNGSLTQSFNVSSGVKQGDNISPLLFSLYLNDLATGIKSLNCGVDINDINLAILLYADDIVLMAPNEDSLQKMISYVYEWCRKWRMAINTDKTQIVHFRTTRSARTHYPFNFGGASLSIVAHYKYLGVLFDEHLNFDLNATTLSKSALRALGGIKNKLRNLKECGYKSFNTLFSSGVISIADYSAGIWGTKTFPQIEQVQYHAARYYLGVHRFAATEGLLGDMGWSSAKFRHSVLTLKFWNRLCKLDTSRITRKVFDWDRLYSNKKGTWSYHVRHLFDGIGCSDVFHTAIPCDIPSAETILHEIDVDNWDMNRYKDKLRYYNMYKCTREKEDYLSFNITRYQRSLMAQFRLGILPLEIEVGRFRDIPLCNRICRMCNANVVEDEIHFLCECVSYAEHRSVLFANAIETNPNFASEDVIDKFVYLMSNHQKSVITFLTNAVYRRINSLYILNMNS